MKKFLTHDQMIDYLKENKKIFVSSEYSNIFVERNYISIINPYKTLFAYGKKKDGSHYYKDNVSIEEIMTIIRLDDLFCQSLYNYIGAFERRIKEEVITHCCKPYVEKGDTECVTYSEEIKIFLENGATPPLFSPNIFKRITKNNFVDIYVADPNYKYQKEFLEHIYNLSNSKNIDGTVLEKELTSNHLIKHYHDTQNICPLWVIPNALTFGEVIVLFKLLPLQSQKDIVSSIMNYCSDVSIADVFSFSGKLEMIRNLRNIINHYEPLFPYLCDNFIDTPQKITAIFVMLQKIYQTSIFTDSHNTNHLNCNDISVKETNYNKKMLDILRLMNQYK